MGQQSVSRTVSATNCPPQSRRRMLAPNHWEGNVPDIPNCNKFDVRKRREMRAPLSDYTRLQSHIWCVMPSFQLLGLPFGKFASLFALSDSALAERNVHRDRRRAQSPWRKLSSRCSRGVEVAPVSAQLALSQVVHAADSTADVRIRLLRVMARWTSVAGGSVLTT